MFETKTYAPDATAFGHPLQRLANALKSRAEERSRRRRMTRLRALDDHMLKDIGVTRGEVDIALSSPWDRNASDMLTRMSLERRRLNM